MKKINKKLELKKNTVRVLSVNKGSQLNTGNRVQYTGPRDCWSPWCGPGMIENCPFEQK